MQRLTWLVTKECAIRPVENKNKQKGNTPVVRAYMEQGVKYCEPVYNALDAATYFAVHKEARFSADLAFPGNRMPDREQCVARIGRVARQHISREHTYAQRARQVEEILYNFLEA